MDLSLRLTGGLHENQSMPGLFRVVLREDTAWLRGEEATVSRVWQAWVLAFGDIEDGEMRNCGIQEWKGAPAHRVPPRPWEMLMAECLFPFSQHPCVDGRGAFVHSQS